MTDADLLRLYTEATERAAAAERSAAYEQGRRDALREILEALRPPAPAPPPPAEGETE